MSQVLALNPHPEAHIIGRFEWLMANPERIAQHTYDPEEKLFWQYRVTGYSLAELRALIEKQLAELVEITTKREAYFAKHGNYPWHTGKNYSGIRMAKRAIDDPRFPAAWALMQQQRAANPAPQIDFVRWS